MTIQDAYSRYQIIPSLQLHQYRVAGVASFILEKSASKMDREVISACLLHDMGNIIKFNLSLFPSFFEPEGVAYWQTVKDRFVITYGNDETQATLLIAREIFTIPLQKIESSVAPHSSVIHPHRVLELIESVGFSKAGENAQSLDWGAKIAAYADMRVEPHGVTSLENRLREGSKRFGKNKPHMHDGELFKEMSKHLRSIESQLAHTFQFDPGEITESTVAPYIKDLPRFELMDPSVANAPSG